MIKALLYKPAGRGFDSRLSDFLEPCGPLQACNGTALPLILFREIVAIQSDNCAKSNKYYLGTNSNKVLMLKH